MNVTYNDLYKQYLFWRKEMRKPFSYAIERLSFRHHLNEETIIRKLMYAEENTWGKSDLKMGTGIRTKSV